MAESLACRTCAQNQFNAWLGALCDCTWNIKLPKFDPQVTPTGSCSLPSGFPGPAEGVGRRWQDALPEGIQVVETKERRALLVPQGESGTKEKARGPSKDKGPKESTGKVPRTNRQQASTQHMQAKTVSQATSPPSALLSGRAFNDFALHEHPHAVYRAKGLL